MRTAVPKFVRKVASQSEAKNGSAKQEPGTAGAIATKESHHGAIAVHFGGQLSIAWDTSECRWLYAWRGDFLDREQNSDDDDATTIAGELVYLSDGPAPLSVTMGAAGGARYFGHRLIDGVPEFLYTVGKLKVTERIQPSDDGSEIIQHFSVERHPVDLILSVPLPPRGIDSEKANPITFTDGKREGEGDFVIVPSEKAGDFTVSYRIGTALPRPDAPPPRPVARPVVMPQLTQVESASPTPATDAIPKPAEMAKNEKDATPSPKSKPTEAPLATSEPSPAPMPAPSPAEPGPRIVKAERYDRDILLTDPHVRAGSLKAESTAFADREFKFTEVPDELIGADHVLTFDRDKYIPGDILSYRVELDRDATVWLLLDKRLDPLPKWATERFKDSGKTATIDSGETFRLFRADAAAGDMRFGSQDSGAGANFYLIAVTDSPPEKNKEAPSAGKEAGGKSKQ